MELMFAKSCWEYWPGTWLTKSPALQMCHLTAQTWSSQLQVFHIYIREEVLGHTRHKDRVQKIRVGQDANSPQNAHGWLRTQEYHQILLDSSEQGQKPSLQAHRPYLNCLSLQGPALGMAWLL
uniref:Uncharacterized protein n=1 Tax=Rousettus aegyptiacus TaxID=9407 RepID=A0A7J8JHB5_ROUAE|nr:hypothetical protein HJG63_010114 [Rousettus aegyptiacus]